MRSSEARAAMEDQDIVSCILTRLTTPQDRLSASLVCKLWNAALALNLTHLPVRSRVLLHRLSRRFSHIQELDLRRCWDALQDSDLEEAAPFLHGIKCLRIGDRDNPQLKLSDVGLISLACHCPLLQRVVISSLPKLSDQAIIFVAERCPLLLALSLENCPCLGDSALAAIGRCRNLEELNLKGNFCFTSQGLQLICNPSLLRIHFEFRKVRVEHALKSMSLCCRRIQEVSLSMANVDFKDVKFTTLTSLKLQLDQWIDMNEAIAEIVAANKHLRELVINLDSDDVVSTSAVVAVLKTCHTLEALHIHSSRLTATLLKSILAYKSLQSLALVCVSKSSRQDLSEVSSSTLDLKHLSLTFTEDLLDAELQLLLRCTRHRLECLNLKDSEGISSVCISAIGQCSNLQSLDLSYTAVDNVSLRIIADGIKHLTVLRLSGCNSISKFGIVAQFSVLEYLCLDNCSSVNDRVLGTIARGCRQLAHLSLVLTGITDNGLHHLVQCGQLRRLRIAHCAKTQAGSGLLAVANACGWLHYLMISPWSIDSKILVELNNQFCLFVDLLSDRAYEKFSFCACNENADSR